MTSIKSPYSLFEVQILHLVEHGLWNCQDSHSLITTLAQFSYETVKVQRSIKVPWKSAQNRDKRLIRALVSAKTIKKTSPSWAKDKWSGADFFHPENVWNQSKYFQVPPRPTTSMICWRVTPNVSTRGEDSFSTGRFCLESKEFEKWNQQKPIFYNGLLVSWVKRRTYLS